MERTSGLLPNFATLGADVNGDGKIGLAAVICMLQKAAEVS